MCGIAGSVNNRLTHEKILQSMIHRGPDEQNGYTHDNVDFFHLRLSIMDISGGKQPMSLGDRYTLIYNGEIYNHGDIRKKYGLLGKTASDTETILMLYQKFGPAFLDELDGMFVIALHDKTNNTVFLARDRAGKKPLYYFQDGQKLVFASELNGLASQLPLEMEEHNFYNYLRLGSFYRDTTPYKKVTELPGGTYLVIDCKNFSIKQTRWWNINRYYQQSSTDTFEQSLEKTDHILHTAVKNRIEASDLEVGCFLSGGIDSGLATAVASNYNHKLKTFTVSFPGEYDEAPLAKLVADKYGTDHTRIHIGFDNLANDVEKILYNYGEPFFDSSAIPSWYVSREARKHLTVIINGDGADELFAGYRRYVPFSKINFFRQNALLRGSAGLIKKVLPYSHNKKSKYNYFYRLASLASKSNLEMYLSAGVDIFEDYEQAIMTPGFDYLEPIRRDFDMITEQKISGLKKIMNMDFDTNLFGDLLVKMDIATMAHSLEGRSPFLCKDFLEYIPSLKDSYKINGSTTKYLLRRLAKKYLPTELINQPKRGFEIPLKNWVDNQLQTIINDYLLAANPLHKTFIEKDFVNRLLERRIKMPDEKRAKIIWTLFCMEVWNKKVYLKQ
jgi:asparagine synthase (glutamine-hydrolysing)